MKGFQEQITGRFRAYSTVLVDWGATQRARSRLGPEEGLGDVAAFI